VVPSLASSVARQPSHSWYLPMLHVSLYGVSFFDIWLLSLKIAFVRLNYVLHHVSVDDSVALL
jgi:hypothetical protein